ncbi:hypothetical protein BH10ACT3_BH10ACT3_14570 [soil metagenome]
MMAESSPILRVSPHRDAHGSVVEPALIWLTPNDSPVPSTAVGLAGPATVVVPVADTGWTQRRAPGDALRLKDSRGARRRWEVVAASPSGCLAQAHQTAYISSGTHVVCVSGEDAAPDPVAVIDLRS